MTRAALTFALAFVTAVVATACPSSGRARSTPSVTPSPSVRLLSFNSPKLNAVDLELKDARVEPNTGLGLGSIVAVTEVIQNLGASLVHGAAGFSVASQVVWQVVEKPRAATTRESTVCEEGASGSFAGTACSLSSLDFRFDVAPRATKTLVTRLRVREFRCPGRGDFNDELLVGLTLPRRGPYTYMVATYFENDAESYLSQRRRVGLAPAIPNVTCVPRSIPLYEQ